MAAAVAPSSGALSLISCVRENSPQPSEFQSSQQASESDSCRNEAKKRRSFHPLRGLRKMFGKRKARSPEPSKEISPPTEIGHESSHRSRSTSELLEDTPIKTNAGLSASLSHDSVFTVDAEPSGSELEDAGRSASEVSMQRLLQPKVTAELAAAVRRRRGRGDTSEEDEDLGLPSSPSNSVVNDGIDRKHVEKPQSSDGSLLSVASSEVDFDSLGISYNPNEGRTHTPLGHDTDLELRSGSAPLSHSAARHKMAVKPRRTHGPPRRRRSSQLPGSPLPSTPEVENEEGASLTNHIQEGFIPQSTKLKSASLPTGLAPGKMMGMERQTKITRSRSSAQSKTIKRFGSVGEEDENLSSEPSSLMEHKLDDKEKKDDSRFGWLLNRRSGKKKKEKADDVDFTNEFNTAGHTVFFKSQHERFDKNGRYSKDIHPKTFSKIGKKYDSESILPDATTTTTEVFLSEVRKSEYKSVSHLSFNAVTKPPRSGASSRQRVEPMDITSSPEMFKKRMEGLSFPHVLPSTNNFNQKLSTSPQNDLPSSVYFGSAAIPITTDSNAISRMSAYDTNVSKVTTSDKHMSLLPKNNQEMKTETKKTESLQIMSDGVSRMQISYSVSPPKTVLQKFLNDDIMSNSPIGKSKSFRMSQEEIIESMQNDLPSLPTIKTSKDIWESEKESNEHMIINSILKTPDKFEENNFMRHSKTDMLINSKDNLLSPLASGIYTKNIIVTTRNSMSQIEANIDNIIGTHEPLLIKKASSVDNIDSADDKLGMKKIASNESVSSTTSFAKIMKNSSSNHSSADNLVNTQSITGQQTDTKIVEKDVISSKQKRESRNFEKITEQVPEFLKIQLNKVESKPATNLVLSTGSTPITSPVKLNDEHKASRKSSTEDVELRVKTESPKAVEVIDAQKTKTETKFDFTRSVSQHNINMTDGQANQPPPLLRMQSADPTSRAGIGYRHTFAPVSSLPPPSPTSKIVKKKTSVDMSDIKQQDGLKRHYSGNDLDKNELFQEGLFGDSNVTSITKEKRSSLTETLKENMAESVVVYRKKSVSQIQTKSNDASELMKVFARLSLKVKDNDADMINEQITNNDNTEKNGTKDTEDIERKDSNKHIKPFTELVARSRDSDKENEDDSPREERRMSTQSSITLQIQVANQKENVTETNKVKTNEVFSDVNKTKSETERKVDMPEKIPKKHTIDMAELLQPKKIIDTNFITNNTRPNSLGITKFHRVISMNTSVNNNSPEIKKDSNDNSEKSEKPIVEPSDATTPISERFGRKIWNTVIKEKEITPTIESAKKTVFRKTSFIGDANKTPVKAVNDRHSITGTEITTIVDTTKVKEVKGELEEPKYKGILQRRAEWELRAQQQSKW